MAEDSIYRLDWSQANFRGGLRTVIVIIGVLVVLILFGTLGITVGLAALFVMIADQPGSLGRRLLAVLSFTIIGSLLAFAGAWLGTAHALIAALLMALIVYLATVAAALGKSIAVRGLLLAIWAVLALSLSGSVNRPVQLSLAFLVGGLLAGAVVWTYGLVRPTEESGEGRSPPISTLIAELETPHGRFAVIRGLSAGLATYTGIVLFPDFPVWAVIAALVILQEERGATFQIGLLRTAGTLLGVIVASAVLFVIGGSEPLVVAAVLASGFAMMALQKVNYAVFTLFLTAMLVLALNVTGDDAVAAGVDRLLATLLGAGIAFVAILATTRTRVAT